jgi:hypothetical protein
MANCKVGDLAITVNAYNPENIGKIVRIIRASGFIEWFGFDEPTWVWTVQTEGSDLTYQYGESPKKSYQNQGEVPDVFLRPIKPLKLDDEANANGEVVIAEQVKKQSLVELALSLGFTMAAEDDPIYSDGVVIISTVGSELEKLEQADRDGL